MRRIPVHPIGVIHSPHTVAVETPIQPVYARGIRGQVEVFSQFTEGLRDLDGFSHIYLVYQFHKAGPVKLLVKPYLEDVPRGVFATRAPCRPNGIGFSVVQLLEIRGNLLEVENIDILNGTPLLDVKPYVPRFDHHEVIRTGWQTNVDESTARIRGRRQLPGGAGDIG